MSPNLKTGIFRIKNYSLGLRPLDNNYNKLNESDNNINLY